MVRVLLRIDIIYFIQNMHYKLKEKFRFTKLTFIDTLQVRYMESLASKMLD